MRTSFFGRQRSDETIRTNGAQSSGVRRIVSYAVDRILAGRDWLASFIASPQSFFGSDKTSRPNRIKGKWRLSSMLKMIREQFQKSEVEQSKRQRRDVFRRSLGGNMEMLEGRAMMAAYVMSAGNKTWDFADIANWTNNFTAGTDATNFASVAIIGTGTDTTTGTRTTKSSATFVTGTSGGLQKGTQALQFLSSGSGATPEAVAVDLTLDFTGRNAGTLSFDWAAIDNASGTRPASFRVFASPDGTSFTELTGAALIDKESSQSPSSGTISSIALPASLNNAASARLRFYEFAGTVTGAGNRDKIQIDNVALTSTPSSSPAITGSTTSSTFSAALGSPSATQSFPITGSNLTANITATAPTGFEVSSNGGTNWGNTASFTQASGSASGTLSVRLKSTASAGLYNGVSISLTSTGATTANITTPSAGNYVTAQTLTAGDVAIIGDISNGTPDSFMIVALADLTAGTTFIIGDNEVTSDGGASFADLLEGAVYFSVNAGQTISKGTVISLPWGSSAVTTTSYSYGDTTGFGLSNPADELYIYTAPSTASTTPTAFIFGINTSTASTGQRPAGLTTGTTFLNVGGSANPGNRYKITGVTNSGSKPQLLAAIGNTASNWEAVAPASTTDWSFTISPTIVGAATATAFTTTYGTASAVQSFSVSGGSLTSNFVATAPTGFEVSADGTTYGSTATFTQTGGSASGTLRIRLAATAAVTGSYNSLNVVLSSTGATSVNIATSASGNAVSAKALTITGVSAINKTYDSTTTASLAGTAAYSGLVNSESFTVTGTPSASFANKNVATAKAVTVTGYTAPSTNYTVSQPAALTANISAASLTISGVVADSRTYNGLLSTTLSGTPILGGAIGLDVVSVSGSAGATFASKTVGTSKTVTVTGYSITGADSANYTVSQPTGLTADIFGRSLTVTATGSDKIYDGSDSATATLSSNKISGDEVTLIPMFSTFTDKNVGPAKTITVSGISISGGADSGNYLLANTLATTTANITAKALTATATASDKVYDTTTSASATVTLGTGVASGDDVSVDPVYGASFATKTAANGKSVSVTGIALIGTDSGNYTVNSSATATANISKYALTATATASNKTYDRTTTASASLTVLPALSGDTVTSSFTSATFSDKNAANGKTVTVSGIAIGGTDGGNYSVNSTTTTLADISTKNLTVTATGSDKVYDGLFSDSVALSNDRISGDVVTGSFTSATFADKNVGSNKTVTVSGISISGADATNYSLANTSATTTATITAVSLTASAIASDKVYDTTTSASATVTLGVGVVSGEDVSFATGYTASFATKTAANGKTVTVTGISLTGADASNYTVNGSATASANITPYALTATATASNKTYDRTTAASATLTVSAALASDVVISSFTSATFSDKTAATGKTVTVSGIALDGTDGGNYSVNSSTTTTADISTKSLTVTATGSDKVYDALTSNSVTLSDDRISGDVFTSSYTSATFADKNVGTSKTVSVTGISISGADASNYSLASTSASTTSAITAKALTATATGVNKTYNALTNASVTYSLPGVISGDTVSVSGSASFATKIAETGKTVTVTGIALSGTDSGNYTVNGSTTTSADISVLAITGSITAADKVENGNNSATITARNLTGVISGDDVSYVGGSATFAQTTPGTNLVVTATGLSLSGADASNYSVNSTATTTANITAPTGVSQTITFAPLADKTYGDAPITLSATASSGLAVTFSVVSGPATISGNMLTITGAGTVVVEADQAGNVTYAAAPAVTRSFSVAQKSLTPSISVANKTYDGTTAATVTYSLAGIVGTDDVTSSGTAVFASKNVGTGIAVNATGITLSGMTSANYVLSSTTASTTANINAKALTATVTASNKVYNATAAASVTYSLPGVVGSEDVTASGTASFADKNVGTGKTVTATVTLVGADIGNYTVNPTATTTADISAAALTVTATATNKTYDATAAASVTLSDNRISGDVVTTSFTSATFASKSVGTGKAVTVSGIAISGADAGNYTFNTTATTSADISAASLTASITATGKVYNGTTAASVSYSLIGVLLSDAVTAGGTATFDTKNVGTGKTVTSTITLSGADAGNYTVNSSATTTADITAKALTATITSPNRVYNATTAASVTYSLPGVVGTEDVTASGTASFADKNVGTGKTVTATVALSGADIGNYTVNSTATTTTNITAASLAITATAANKTYDGTTSASVTLSDNRISGDVLTTSFASATFSTKSAGTGKTVTVSGITISGTDAGNYTANSSTTTTANISVASLTATITATGKVYNGTIAASVTYSMPGIASGDAVTVSGTSTFDTKNVGTGKTVTATGLTLAGADSSNYVVNSTATTTADITAKALTATITATSRAYNATTAVSVTYALSGIVGTEVVTASGTASFADKNVGTAKTVTATGISLAGADAGNYSVNTTATATANITAVSITPTVTGVNRVYDATTVATVTYGLPGLIAGDAVTASGTATFTAKAVGTAKPITVTGITLSGADATNYTLSTTTGSSTANVTALALTPVVTVLNKAADGNTGATLLTRTLPVLGTDVVTAASTGYTATFAQATVGTGITVTVTGQTISGTDSGNYTVTNSTTTANIYAAAAFGLGDLVVGVINNSNGANSNAVALWEIAPATAGQVTPIQNVGLPNASSRPASGQFNLTDSANATSDGYLSRSTDGSILVIPGYNGISTDTSIASSASATISRVVGVVNRNATIDTSRAYNIQDAGNARSVAATDTSNMWVGGSKGLNYVSGATSALLTLSSLSVRVSNVFSNQLYYSTASGIFSLTGLPTSGTPTATTLITAGTGSSSYDFAISPDGKTVYIADDRAIASGGGIQKWTSSTGAAGSFTLAYTFGTGTVNSVASTVGARGLTVDFNGTNPVIYATSAEISANRAILITDNGSSAAVTTLATAPAGAIFRGIDFAPKAASTVVVTASNAVYTANAYAPTTVVNGAISSAVTYNYYLGTGTGGTNLGTTAPKNVGTYTVIATFAGDSNYLSASSAPVTFQITAKSLTVAVSASGKTYDGNTSVTATYSLTGVIGSENVTASGTASFASKNSGSSVAVNATGISLSGTGASNYSLASTTASTTAVINAKALTATITGGGKTYDATNAANVSYPLSGIVGSEVVTASGTATYANKNAGAGKTITATGITLGGADAGNYTVNLTATTTATISSASLTATITAASKTYDATTAANVTYSLTGVLLSDDVSVSGSASFDTKNAGTGKTVASTISISGADSGNYTVNNSATTIANVTAKALTATITASNKTYDATAAATVVYSLGSGVISGDSVTISGTASFTDKTIGTAKTVTANSITLAGTDANNYSVNTTATTTADITALAITGSVTVNNKVFDGTNSATISSRTLTGAISGDVVTYVGGTATFDDASGTIGNGKPVTATGLSLSGADAGNYTVNTTATTTANIVTNVQSQTITFAPLSDKTYGDASFALSATASSNLAVTFSIVSGPATISGNTLTITGVGLVNVQADQAGDAGYSAAPFIQQSFTVAQKALTATITAATKTYDRTTTASVTYSLVGVVGSDVVSASGTSASFDNKNVGTNKTVTASGITLGGANAGNYTVNSTATTTSGSITALAITGSVTVADKPQDDTTSATVLTRTLPGVLSGDIVSYVGGVASFDTAEPGLNKTVTVTGLSLNGTDKDNYSVNTTATTTATITAVNHAPTDLSLSSSSISENQAVGATVGTFATTDRDASDTFTYSLATGTGSTDNASFTIDNVSGVGTLKAAASFDFETQSSYSIRVRTTDQGGLFFEKMLTISVTNVNEAPTNVALSSTTIAENAGANALVGNFSSTDPDAANSFNYSLVSGSGSDDNSAFTVTGNTLTANASFDFETSNSYSIRVRTTDQGGLTFDKVFTILVTNVNETPTNIALSSTTIAENAGANAVVGTLSTTDPDASNTFTYALVSGTGSTDNAAFTIAGNTLTANASFDFETKSSYSVRVQTTDQGGLTFDKVFTINVTNVNEAPTDVAASSTTIAENAGANALVGGFTTTDPDAGNTFSYSLVSGTGSTDNAAFTVTGNTLSANASFDFETKSSYSIRVQSTDQGGLSFEKVFTVSVTNVNEAPTNIALSSTSIAENAGANAVVGTLTTTDPDTGNTFSYALVTGTGSTDNSAFTVTGNTLTANASFDFETQTSYSVRVRSTDQGGLTFDKVFTISVTNVNEAPGFAFTNYSFTVSENSAAGTVVGNVSATDPDAGTSLTYSLSGTGASNFVINSTGAITVAAGATLNFEGINSFALTATVSDGALSATSAVAINLTNVNEAPAGTDGTITLNEDGQYTFSAADFGFTDPSDVPANSLQAVKIVTRPASGSLTLNGTTVGIGQLINAVSLTSGSLKFTPVANASGTPYGGLTFQVQDDGGTANGGVNLDPTPNTLNINVNAVNDASIVATSSGVATFIGAGSVVIDSGVTVSDIDSTTLVAATVSITSGLASSEDVLGFVNAGGITGSYNATTGVLTLTGTASLANYQAALRTVTYNNTNATASGTPSTATRTIAFQVNDGGSENNLSNVATRNVSVSNSANQALFVQTATANATGVDVLFNRPVSTGQINLYDQAGALGAADVTLVGASTGAVRGSLIFNSTNTGFTFIKTGMLTATGAGAVVGTLDADTYTLTLRSNTTNGFADTAGNALRNASNVAGNFVQTFTVGTPTSGALTLSIPDFARGFGQAVNVPNTSTGLPIVLSNGNNVSGIDFTVNYDPTLLTITGFATTIAGATATVNTATPGVAVVQISTATSFAVVDGAIILGSFAATVPATAPYGSKELLRFTNIRAADASDTVNDIPLIADNGVHVAAFFGDTNGDTIYSAADTTLLARASVGTNTGFSAFQLADPFITGDISSNFILNSSDTTSLARQAVGTTQAAIPALPTGITPPAPGGLDPRMFISKNLVAVDLDPTRDGIQIDIPINLEVTDVNGITISGFDAAIAFDSSKLKVEAKGAATIGSLLSDSSGNLLSGPFAIAYSVSNGVLRLQAFNGSGSTLLPFGTTGTLFTIRATVSATATGTSVINLLANAGGTFTGINDNNVESLVLIPAPSNAADDSVDGLLTIPESKIAATKFDLRSTQPIANVPSNQFKDILLTYSPISVNGNAGTVVGKLSSIGFESKNVTYALVSGTGSQDNTKFKIVNDQLQVTDSIARESGKSSYVVRLRATDLSGLSVEKSVGIDLAR